MMRITPNPGLVVPGPDGRVLPPEGLVVNDAQITRFWRRRQADGDVNISPVADAPADETAKKKG